MECLNTSPPQGNNFCQYNQLSNTYIPISNNTFMTKEISAKNSHYNVNLDCLKKKKNKKALLQESTDDEITI